MKLSIAICEDTQAESEYITMLINRWSAMRNHPLSIDTFRNAESFLFAFENANSIPEILLLDIQMPGMDGVTLAKKVREKNSTVQIVFITGIPDFISEGYEVEALHYLLKPIKEEKFFGVLDRAVNKRNRNSSLILLPKTGGDVRIPESDILYAEVVSHTITLYCTHYSETFNMRLSDMETLLGKNFYKCHRSFIVSMACIRRITRSAILLDCGKEIPISRGLYEKASEAFMQYLSGKKGASLETLSQSI